MAIIGQVNIMVNTQLLINKSNEVTNSILQVEKSFESLDTAINRTAYYWIGVAGDNHRKIYNDQKYIIEEMLNRLKEHPKDLLAIAGIYDDASKNKSLKELPGDVIT
jgi:hypothetical protein